MKRSVFIHRRDLRIDDNTALGEAGRSGTDVVPCFIVDPRQVDENPYRSDTAVQFMLESLVDLDGRYRERGGRLHVLHGEAHEVVAGLVREHGIGAVYVNRDYTPFSKRRDDAMAAVCADTGVEFHSLDDALLHPPGSVMKSDGTPYTVFTPYHNRASEQPLREPIAFEGTTAVIEGASDTSSLREWMGIPEDTFTSVRGGRSRALEILSGLERLRSYHQERDLPALPGTTQLSAYLKFGCCSAREAARAIRDALGENHELLRQLHWRDFFTQVAYFHPHVFDGPFHERYAAIEWENDESMFEAWRKGRTGFPIVDGGMRELEQTGYMHNRARMITASFLTKDLHIDWRWGERHFASRLIDYDPAVNNGNWQWAASTGCDAQPFFRIFNPWLQQKKFDPDAVYVKTWVEELRALAPAEIHNLWKTRPDGLEYPEPLVDHKARSREAKAMYEAARQASPPKTR